MATYTPNVGTVARYRAAKSERAAAVAAFTADPLAAGAFERYKAAGYAVEHLAYVLADDAAEAA